MTMQSTPAPDPRLLMMNPRARQVMQERMQPQAPGGEAPPVDIQAIEQDIDDMIAQGQTLEMVKQYLAGLVQQGMISTSAADQILGTETTPGTPLRTAQAGPLPGGPAPIAPQPVSAADLRGQQFNFPGPAPVRQDTAMIDSLRSDPSSVQFGMAPQPGSRGMQDVGATSNTTGFGFNGFPNSNEILRDALSRTQSGRNELFFNFLSGNQQYQGFNPRARGILAQELNDPLQAAFILSAVNSGAPEGLDFRNFLAQGGGGGRIGRGDLSQYSGLFNGLPGSDVGRAQRDLLEENATLLISQAAGAGLNPLLRPYAENAGASSVGAYRDRNLVDPVFAQYYNGGLY